MAGRAFSAFYARSFEQHPWITLGVANATLGALSDVIAQNFEAFNKRRALDSASATISDNKGAEKALVSRNDSAGYDPVRSARFFAFGAGMAPILAEWNKFIEHRFPLKATSTASTGAAAAAAVTSGARTAVKNAAVAAGKTSLKAWAKRVAVDQIAL
jgi:protein Mpv17